MQVIASTAGRYEIQEQEFGQVYKWHPETVVIECGCGEKPSLTSATTTCKKCGELWIRCTARSWSSVGRTARR